MSERSLQVNFDAGRPLSAREKEILDRVMRREAWAQIQRWEEIDATKEENREASYRNHDDASASGVGVGDADA